MTKIEYLFKALNAGLYNNISWITSMVSEVENVKPFDYLPYHNEDGWYFDIKEEAYLIEDYQGGAMFHPADKILIPSNTVPNLVGSLETRFGILYTNYVLLVECFGTGISYVNGEMNVGDIEEIIANRMEDNTVQEEEGHIYVKDKLKFTQQVSYLRSQSMLFTVVATPRNITAPDNLKQLRTEILKKYEGKLDDPIEQAKFENEMRLIDEEWLKDDPSNNHLISGKMKNSRLKMYGTFGSSTGFDNTATPHVVSSLDEGLPTDGDALTGLINSLRAGSYSRAKLTEIGGVTANIINRSMSPVTIADGNCGSKVYQNVIFREGDNKRYIGTYSLRPTGEIKPLMAGDIKPGRKALIRSPLYCKSSGYNFCSVCAGDKLSERKKAVILAVSHINSRILYYYMKLFHVTILETKKLDIIGRIT